MEAMACSSMIDRFWETDDLPWQMGADYQRLVLFFDIPIKIVIFHSYVAVYQRVTQLYNQKDPVLKSPRPVFSQPLLSQVTPAMIDPS